MPDDYDDAGERVSILGGELRRFEQVTDNVRAAYAEIAPDGWSLSIRPMDDSSFYRGHDTFKVVVLDGEGVNRFVAKFGLRQPHGEWRLAQDVEADITGWLRDTAAEGASFDLPDDAI